MTGVSKEVLLGLQNQVRKFVNTYRIGAEDRQDLVQEAMIKLWKAGRMSNPGYVSKVVRSAAMEHFRKEGRRSVHWDLTVEYDQYPEQSGHAGKQSGLLDADQCSRRHSG